MSQALKTCRSLMTNFVVPLLQRKGHARYSTSMDYTCRMRVVRSSACCLRDSRGIKLFQAQQKSVPVVVVSLILCLAWNRGP